MRSSGTLQSRLQGRRFGDGGGEKLGDRVQLYHGDCLELLKNVPDTSVDMVLCDLPYGVTKCKWDSVIPFDSLWSAYRRILKPHGVVALFGVEPFSSKLRMSNLEQFKYDWIWEKTNASGFLNAKKQPMRCHETISVFYDGQCTYNPQMIHGQTRKVSSANSKKNCKKTDAYGEHGLTGYDSTDRYPRSVQVFASDIQKNALHTTQKPIALLEYLILTYTNSGEIVLDNCMGSGSTGVAAVRTGRRFIGMELDDKYFELAKERINKESAQVSLIDVMDVAQKNQQMSLWG